MLVGTGLLSVCGNRCGSRFIRRYRLALEVLLDVFGAVAVEQVPNQAAVEIGGPEQPVSNGKCQVSVRISENFAFLRSKFYTNL